MIQDQKSNHLVAALFVHKNGAYSNLDYVDPWDESRDARLYRGTLPVVCHPPCNLWVNFAFVNYNRWGGEHNRPGNDGGCFASALRAVCRNGGVLEHPAFSHAWKAFSLKRPIYPGWNQVGDTSYVCEVWQSAYGHKAQKRTWLYYVGNEPKQLRWDRPKGTHQIGGYNQYSKNNKPSLMGKKASATPIPFRDALLTLALGCWS